MQRTLIILLVSLIPFNSFIFAETYINGEVSGTWTKNNAPYIATGNLLLPKGKNLTIQPGVTVKFKGAYRFEIYGRLEAIGAVTDTIVFTHYTNHPDSTWRGLRYNQADSTGKLEYCKIEYAKAAGSSSDYLKGGGLFLNNNSNITIKNCLIWNNKADYGAGIYIYYASPKIVATTIKDNSAYYNGGGIWMENSATLIVNSRFQNNYARHYGGGIYQNNASRTPLVYGSSFFNNRADYNRVHELYCYTIVLVNSVFSNNLSWPNTAIFFYGHDSKIQNCIFDYTEYAKTIHLRFDAKVEIINSVIMNVNFTASDGDLKNLSIQYSNIQSGWPGEGNINADPLFVDRKNHDYHLKANSPCQNAGHASVFFNDWDGSRNDMGIFGGSGLMAKPLEIDFGPLGISQQKIGFVSITNFRDTYFQIQSVTVADNQNFSSVTSFPLIIQSMTSKNIEIAFHPQRSGQITSSASVTSLDFKGSTDALIGLKGIGGVWSGNVSGVWTRANSPYIIGGSITVPFSASLTIEPGVAVTIDTTLAGSSAKFIVEGTLQAAGTEADSIVFTTVPGQERPGAWQGIVLKLRTGGAITNHLVMDKDAENKSGFFSHAKNAPKNELNYAQEMSTGNQGMNSAQASNALLSYCRIEFAKIGVQAEDDKIEIDHCSIQKNSQYGIYWYGILRSASGKLTNSTIKNNAGWGVNCHAVCSSQSGYANPLLEGNQIHNNMQGGIYLFADGDSPSSWYGTSHRAQVLPTVKNNKIVNNSGSAIECRAHGVFTEGIPLNHRSYAIARPWISYNIITNNIGGIVTICPNYNSSYGRLSRAEIIYDRNTAWQNGQNEIVAADSASVTITNSIIWNPNSQMFLTRTGGIISASFCDFSIIYPGEKNIQQEPLWVAPASGDFNLTYLSHCIDAGNPDSLKDTDNTIPDMGARYYHQSISEFSLNKPANRSVVRSQNPTLVWNIPATIGGEPLKYELYYHTAPIFSDPNAIHIQDLSQNEFTPSVSLIDFNNYYWQVKAKNPWGMTRLCKEVYQFTVNTDTLPPSFSVTLPVISFNEDQSLSLPISFWYDFVEDDKTLDSLLTITVSPGKYVAVTTQNKISTYTPKKDWFGIDTLKLTAKDFAGLSNSAFFNVKVRPINDPPLLTGLPDSIIFAIDSSAVLKIWDYVQDIESSDEQLQYSFSATNDSLSWKFNSATGDLKIQSKNFLGRARLDITVTDDSSAYVHGSVFIRVYSSPSGVFFSGNQIPTSYQLLQNFPNPFNSQTTIPFSLPVKSQVSIGVFNLKGEKVMTLYEGSRQAGNHLLTWNAMHLSSGTYFIKIEANDFRAMRQCMLIK